jgi:hypothetical protein
LRRRITADQIGKLSVSNRIEADLDCAMVPINPTTWMPIVYPAGADEDVKSLCETVDPKHPILNGKRQHDHV